MGAIVSLTSDLLCSALIFLFDLAVVKIQVMPEDVLVMITSLEDVLVMITSLLEHVAEVIMERDDFAHLQIDPSQCLEIFWCSD
jgi:hypothetical protein